jgi:hypothetical protein
MQRGAHVIARSGSSAPPVRALQTVFWVWFVVVNVFFTGRALYLTLRDGAPTEPYQIWWAGAFGAVQLIVAVIVLRARWTLGARRPWLVFGGASLVLAMTEELTCYVLASGIFSGGGNTPVPVLFGVATVLVWIPALGGLAVYRLFQLRWHQALLLFAFSGYLQEAFLFTRSEPLPILVGLIPPLAAWHYVLIGLFPFLLVRDRIEPTRRWDHPVKWIVGLLLPTAIPTLVHVTLLR